MEDDVKRSGKPEEKVPRKPGKKVQTNMQELETSLPSFGLGKEIKWKRKYVL